MQEVGIDQPARVYTLFREGMFARADATLHEWFHITLHRFLYGLPQDINDAFVTVNRPGQ